MEVEDPDVQEGGGGGPEVPAEAVRAGVASGGETLRSEFYKFWHP